MTLTFLDRLELVAGHPLVYVAFIIVVIVWLARLFLVKKNEPFDLVEQLPAKDRAGAIDTIVSGVPEKLSDERASLIGKRYNIFALIVTFLFICILCGLAVFYFSKSDNEIKQIKLDRIEESVKENNKANKKAFDRLSTKFDSIFIQAIFKAPKDHKMTSELISFMNYIDDLKLSGVLNRRSSQIRAEDGTFKETNRIISLDITSNNSENIDSAISMGVVKHPDVQALFEFFKQPRMSVGFNKSTPLTDNIALWLINSSKDQPQLLLHTHRSPTDNGNTFRLTLDVDRQDIYLSWNGFTYDKKHWVSTREISSITDISNAWIGLIFTGSKYNSDNFISELAPEWVNIRFDNNFATAVNFDSRDSVLNTKAYTSSLPSAKDILGGIGISKHPIVHVGGF